MYGEVYEWESIEDVILKEELPTIVVRTNGSALGSNLKGHFRTEEFGPIKLFVNTQKPPFIYLHTAERLSIFNRGTPDQTKATYEEILKVLAGKHQ